MIGCSQPLTGSSYHRGSNVSGGIPFLGGTNPPRRSPFPLPFLGNVNFFGSYPFPRGIYPLSMFHKKGENIFLWDRHIREVILTLLINIWGDNMVLLV